MNVIQYLRLCARANRYLRKDEPDECRFVCDVLERGQNVADIGAHKGAYTYWMSRGVGASGRVYAFEPQPELAAYLQGFAIRRRYRNVTVCAVALSDGSRRQRLTVPHFRACATLEPCSDVTGCTLVEVPVAAMDDYLASIHAQRPISLIKCDVELHELPVLRGAQRLLKSDMPILLVESRSISHVRVEENRTFEFLRELGYSGYFFASGELVPFNQYSSERHGIRIPGVQNFVFLHPERVGLTSPRRPFAVRWVTDRRQVA